MSSMQAHVIDLPKDANQTSHWQSQAPVSEQAKWSFVTRNVDHSQINSVGALPERKPEPGDLLVARVLRLAQHTKIQLPCGRRSALFPGDDIVVAYGNRYAPDQFEAEVPTDFGHCHLVAAGGVAARALSKNSKLKWPTDIQPQGYLLNQSNQVMNLRDFSQPTPGAGFDQPVICVAGTSMNAGKTTVMASLIHGFSAAGRNVAAIKVTGTGAGNDIWAYTDAGARLTLDFTDAGFVSTYLLSDDAIAKCMARLVNTARARADIDVVLMEVADGLLHNESLNLLTSPEFKSLDARLVFAAGEAMGATAGVSILAEHGLRASAISGVVSASQLAAHEASKATGLPVLSKGQLQCPDVASGLL